MTSALALIIDYFWHAADADGDARAARSLHAGPLLLAVLIDT